MPNSGAEREPFVQARGHSPPRRSEAEGGFRGSFKKPRHKELEKVDVPPYPEITKLLTWRSGLIRAVIIAANSPDAQGVTDWIHATWAEGQTYEALGSLASYQYVTLDMKLAQGMMNMASRAGDKAKRYRDKINLKIEEVTRHAILVTGSQLVFMLLESFKTFDHSDLVYGFDHLGRLLVKNHDLHEFITMWNHILDNMGKHNMSDAHLRDVFYRKIKDEPEMDFDIKLYERMSEGDPNKTYAHLRGCVQKIIQMQEQRKNLAEREALLTAKHARQEGKTSTAVPAATGADRSNKTNKRSDTQGNALGTDQTGQEVTPKATAKAEGTKTSKAEKIQSTLIPGAKAKAVGVMKSFF
jgi:hypothetical protein